MILGVPCDGVPWLECGECSRAPDSGTPDHILCNFSHSSAGEGFLPQLPFIYSQNDFCLWNTVAVEVLCLSNMFLIVVYA